VDAELPVVAIALQTKMLSGNPVWNLHAADGALIGWSPDLPGPLTTQPTCYQYHSGECLDIAFADGYRKASLL